MGNTLNLGGMSLVRNTCTNACKSLTFRRLSDCPHQSVHLFLSTLCRHDDAGQYASISSAEVDTGYTCTAQFTSIAYHQLYEIITDCGGHVVEIDSGYWQYYFFDWDCRVYVVKIISCM